ncbi:hypothetical protein U9M48_035771 [Paspalum notatum var. saurae]|uniref:Mitochondrial protein n=1 Tax=Paspalum notatum var. saurae TaxID=547442 RepID=A0AAQ3X9C2_PASNO
MERPTEEHQQAVKRLLRYFAATIDYGFRYERRWTATRLIGYPDADLAGDIDTRKSNSGVLFFLGDCLISWQSVKQKAVVRVCGHYHCHYTINLVGSVAR